MNKVTLEEQIFIKDKYSDEFDREEIIEDYLPRVKEHIGFKDERRDTRFVVKFHDVCYYTNTPEDMSEEEFETLFETFCNDMYESTKQVMEDNHMNKCELFKIRDVGHYSAFEMIIPEITEENYLDVTVEIYEEGLAPSYIDDYVTLVEHLQDMEDNYMEYWLEHLRVNDIPETTIKNIERRYKKDNPKK